MGAAASAAISIVGGIAGMSQQSSQAAAQKRILASQEKQQALNAQLQYLNIKNQSYADSLNDQINESVRSLAFTQSQQNTDAQERLNQLAVSNALFDSSVQKVNADIGKSQQQLQTQQELSNANAQANQQELEGLGSASQTNGQDINSILANLSKGGQASDAIANLLDIAASSGGINEALSLLGSNDTGNSTTAQANLNRSQDLMATRGANSSELANSSKDVAKAGAKTADISGTIGQQQAKFAADTQALDANTSSVVAGAGFDATRAANTATHNVGIITDASTAFSRKYLSAANLAAIDQGAAIQSDIISAQKSQVKTPGFLDFVGVGYNGYSTYKGLGGGA